jgi:DNA-directed RNA polymerase subunit M/transcription elongation factor TFIIS
MPDEPRFCPVCGAALVSVEEPGKSEKVWKCPNCTRLPEES